MEEVRARHRLELKELQGKITSKKKNATKKTRKGVNDECERLEQELKERQQAELLALIPATSPDDETSQHNEDEDEKKADHNGRLDSPNVEQQPAGATGNAQAALDARAKKPNRQKARLARKAAEQEAQIQAAEREAASMPDQRQQELTAMRQQMSDRGLSETLIRPDGHCLYSACAHTIPSLNGKDYRNVRIAAAEYIGTHPDDFAPFMEEPIDSYTHKIKSTAEWGGHLELQAIAKAFDINIHVLQADGHVEEIKSNDSAKQDIWLAYYKHSFGLGEHYNALIKAAAG
ncbi:OTU protein [Lithohypha guttulata]|uniref:OTU protein n=1 Tax=Lithohypha guttulata TaxID=1690604 RepID=A0AAN7STR2_9EURO|nr:OTU protein [Lithohypha guttulata]KAK5102065.1 OTU protein [Lithohypha guttulata]